MRRSTISLVALLLALPLPLLAVSLQTLPRGPATTLGTPGAGKSDTGQVRIAGRVGAKDAPAVLAEIKKGNHGAAVRLAEQMLAREPKSGLAYELLGTARFAAGNTGEAAKAFRKATQVEPDQNGPWTKLGILQFGAGDLGEAEASLKEAIRRDEGDRVAHQWLGILYDSQGKATDAIREYQLGMRGTESSYVGVAVPLARLLVDTGQASEALSLLAPRVPANSTNAEAQLALAGTYYALGDFKRAHQRYARTLELDPRSSDAALGVAASLRGQGDLAAALKVLEALLKKLPNWEGARIEYARTLLALNREDDALKQFRKVGELQDDRTYAAKAMAQNLIELDQPDRAARYFRQLVTQPQADEDSFARYSELLLAQGKPDAGRQGLQDGLKRHPDSAYLHYRLGSYLASVRRYSDAVVALRRAAELAPRNSDILVALSLAQARQGDAAAAAETAKRLYDLDRTRSGSALLYAVRLEAAGKGREAERIYRRVLEQEPRSTVALNNLAGLLADRKSFDEAEILARRAVASAPGNAQVLDTLGWTLFRKGDVAEAAKTLARAAQLNPDLAVVHYHRGLVLERQGDRAGARAALKRALELEPAAVWSSKAKEHLSRLP
jgi:tetratricopeptide (TPR) repeat protein